VQPNTQQNKTKTQWACIYGGGRRSGEARGSHLLASEDQAPARGRRLEMRGRSARRGADKGGFGEARWRVGVAEEDSPGFEETRFVKNSKTKAKSSSGRLVDGEKTKSDGSVMKRRWEHHYGSWTELM